ncbi:fungal fucose-specific lectin [Aspergillus violaceofuscus CBS 115571]|uniref:Fucose-specific lectin n=1 Tax=Aspergillus violaceofuscus (strain CBS 115571) TaxID=1450538 RepID=A0A2V5HAR9_ASPV1|nr:fungal fucose-specific lectin [Aspergillus violaceofuscus CBS 115571]
MSNAGAQEIRFRCAIAAVGSEDNFQVYTQDTNGRIRETRFHDGQWSGGSQHDVVAQAILGSPIAAVCRTSDTVNLFFIGEDRVVREVYRDNHGRWHEGSLNRHQIKMAPYSMMAACCHRGKDTTHLRVYVQMQDNTIQELGQDDEKHGWSKMTNLGRALPGSGLACVSPRSSDSHDSAMKIRVYHQKDDLSLREKLYDGRQWKDGEFSVSQAPPRTDLAATVFHNDRIRVYFVHEDNQVMEMACDDDKWQRGGFRQQCVPGSQVAALAFSRREVQLRIFFQSGKHVTGVTEWKYEREWKQGKEALPPA